MLAAKGRFRMLEKTEKLVKEVRTELSEVIVANKIGADSTVKACLIRAKKLLGTFLQQEYGYG